VSTSPAPEPGRSRSGRSGHHFLGGTGERRRARERALELTYEAEQKEISPVELLAELPLAPTDYALQLITGLTARLDDAYELISELDVPVAVVIDEAVELAKEYSTEDSPRFVNGVLAAIADTVRPNDTAKPAGGRAARSPR
jgi:N utilization substance protein B